MALHKTELDNIFPEEYLIQEDEMGESVAQAYLISYLVQLLQWYYRLEGSFVVNNLELYHPQVRNSQHKITPDVCVFKKVTLNRNELREITSWNIAREKAPPDVVFEISSSSTWQTDIAQGERDKPQVYGRIGVQEYFAYDPCSPQAWQGVSGRLKGWRYNPAEGRPFEISPEGSDGRLWSEALGLWLVPDEEYLRLLDPAGNRRLTEAEAEAQARQAAELRIAELERQLREFKGE